MHMCNNFQKVIMEKSAATLVEELLDKLHASADSARFEEYFSCYHAQARFLGTDGSENWDMKSFREYALPHFMSGRAWSFHPCPGSRILNFFPSAEAASLGNGFVCFDEKLTGGGVECFSRGSGTVIYDPLAKKWLVMTYHLVFPIPNDIARCREFPLR